MAALERGVQKSLGRMVLRGTAWLIGGRVARTVVTLGGLIVLARLLTPADFGVVAVAAMILPLSRGLLDGLIDVPTIREDDLDREDLANLIWTAIGLMLFLVAALWFLAPLLAAALNSPKLSDALRILSMGLLLQPVIAASSALLRRQHRFREVGTFALMAGAAYICLAIPMAAAGFGLWSLIVGQLGSLGVTAVASSWSSRAPIAPPRRLRPAAALRLGGIGLVVRLLSWIAANIDTLFVSAVLGPTGAGIYSRAYNITTQIKEPFAAVDQTVRQAFIAQRHLDDSVAARATTGGYRLVMMAACLVSGSIVIFREAIVVLLLGPQWDAVVLPLAVLSASLPARIALVYLDGFAYARGSMPHLLRRNIATILILVVGLWMWTSDGVVAVSIVTAAAQISRLFFLGGELDRAVMGSHRQRWLAMAPGLILGGLMIALAEGSSALLDFPLMIQDAALRAIICTIVICFVVFFLPRTWLPSSLDRRLPHPFGSPARIRARWSDDVSASGRDTHRRA